MAPAPLLAAALALVSAARAAAPQEAPKAPPAPRVPAVPASAVIPAPLSLGSSLPLPSLEAASLRPERTARLRLEPSHATRLVEPALRGAILDYGAGRGADTAYLRDKGLRAVAYDPHYFPEKPAGRAFDWVLLNYVLNVIPSPAGRDAVLRDLRGFLGEEGRGLVSVLTREEIEGRVSSAPGRWRPLGDGWVRDGEIFERGYERAELAERLSAHGLRPVRWHAEERDSHIVVVEGR